LPELSPHRLDLLPNLGVALTETGRPADAERLLTKAIDDARTAGSERDALRARIQLLSNLAYRAPSEDDMAAAVNDARAAADTLEALGDEVGLAQAAIAIEYLEWMRGRVAELYAWASRALQHALAAGRPREAGQASCDVVLSAVFGPLPFPRFADTAEGLLSSDEPISASTGHALMALSALGGADDSGFRLHERRWREVIDRHGLAWLAGTHALAFAIAEISAGAAEVAERMLRESRDAMATLGDIWLVGTIDGLLCAALGAQDRPREFLRYADSFENAALVLDRDTLIRRHLVRSRAHLLRGSAADAEVEARRGLELVETTDLVLTHAEALILLAEVLDERGSEDEAKTRRTEAEALYRSKADLAALEYLSR
jgi:tetratricopeptide (TPR) repeat protein